MKLLLDENLSRRLVPALQEMYPGSTQIALLGLEQASDLNIWEFARQGDYVLVTKDDDFRGLANLLGFPPKIILLALGNSTNRKVLETLTSLKAEIVAALSAPELGLIEIFDEQDIALHYDFDR